MHLKFLPYPFNLPDGGLVLVALLQSVKQTFIKLQAVSPSQRVRNQRHRAVSQQTHRDGYWRHRYVLCPSAHAAGQQQDEAQVQWHSCYP